MIGLPKEPQTFQSFVHAGERGIERAAKLRGNLSESFAQVDALVNYLALRGRQVAQQSSHAASVVTQGGRFLRSRAIFGRLGGRRQWRSRPRLLFAPGEHRLVVGDGKQPAPQVFAIHAVESLQRPHERILEHVLGQVMVPEYANEELKEGSLVPR
jgi:hypothetical protein